MLCFFFDPPRLLLAAAWRRHLRDGNRPSRLDAAERTNRADQTLARIS